MENKNELDYYFKDDVETVINFHLSKKCNMHCSFCFGGFIGCGDDLGLSDWLKIVDNIHNKLAGKPVRITLAGGEPLLFPEIEVLIKYIYQKGFKVGIITNGQLLTESFIIDNKTFLDNIGISIDSLDPIMNKYTGRCVFGVPITAKDYLTKCLLIKDNNIKLKINTLITKVNYQQDLNDFLLEANPDKWKVLKMLILDGQNEESSFLKISDSKFRKFLTNHKKHKPFIEGDNEMVGSYIIISPSGKITDNVNSKYSYSESLVNSDFFKELKQTNFSPKLFRERYK